MSKAYREKDRRKIPYPLQALKSLGESIETFRLKIAFK